MDTIVSKVKNTPLKSRICQLFFLLDSSDLSVVSFQCPTVYREEMESNLERCGEEQTVNPSERGLVDLHKKVLKNKRTSKTITMWFY